jgi:hypothetical protein
MVTNIFCHPKGFTWREVRLDQEAYFNTLLILENIQFLLSAADTVGGPVANGKAIAWLVRLRRATILRYEEENDF